ncbi:MAG TPA: heavy metal-responsive transcriptional regulator [Pyrinomonadaceae bacterium]|jgi:DNA-binding transcriptional MerR regulator
MQKRASADEHFGSGELARRAGVSTDTLRHYERKGVLAAPLRLSNGYRKYPRETLERVRLVRRALAVGFTLDELASILRERDRGSAPCKEVRSLAATKLADVERRLEELLALRDELRRMLRNWDKKLAGAAPGTQARLLEALNETDTTDNGQQRRAAVSWRERKSKRS